MIRITLFLLAAVTFRAASQLTSSQGPSITSTATPSSSPVWASLFDGTDKLSAAVIPDAPCVLNSTTLVAVSFILAENDTSCGPGQWSLTQLWLPLSQIDGGSTAATLIIQLFQANVRKADGISTLWRIVFPHSLLPPPLIHYQASLTSSPPLASGFAVLSASIAVPVAPSYVAIPLRGLIFDTSTFRGGAYALVLSASAGVNWHSVSSTSPDGLPSPGVAAVLGSWTSPSSPVIWSTLPLSGIWLTAIKRVCSPSPTLTMTLSRTQTPSRTVSRTPSVTQTPSRTRTQTQSPTLTSSMTQSISQTSSATPSESGTGSVTPSLSLTSTPTSTLTSSASSTPSASATGSLSASLTNTASSSDTPSVSGTPSGTPSLSGSQMASPTQTPTKTGFPQQAVIDNTASGTNSVDVSDSRVLSSDVYRAFSFAFNESDLNCGPGTYVLETLTLALSPLDDLPASGTLPLQLLLYAADPVTGVPRTAIGSYLHLALAESGPLSLEPAYYVIPLVSVDGVTTWTVDASLSRAFSVILYSASLVRANWLSPNPRSIDLPAAGTGRPIGTFLSSNYGGSWTVDSAYGSILLSARKKVCSPSPTLTRTSSVTKTPSGTSSKSGTPTLRTQTSSPSGTPTQAWTRSQSVTRSATCTPTKSRTPSVTQSRSRTASQTGTQSSSETASGTATRTMTSTLTGTPSQTSTPTQTQTQSQTGSPTGTPSESPTASAAATRSSSQTGSRSQSRTPTPSGTETRSSTRSSTQSRSSTKTPSGTQAPSRSQTSSPSQSATSSQSQTSTASGTPSSSATSSLSTSQSRSITQSGSSSETSTPSQSQSTSGSPSNTMTPSDSRSATRSPSATKTRTSSRTSTRTMSPSRTISPSESGSKSTSSSRTQPPTPSRSQKPTRSVTPTLTASRSQSQSQLASGSQGLSPTRTSSQAASLSQTGSQSASGSTSVTPSISSSASQSSSGSQAPSLTPSQSPSESSTPSPSPSATATPSHSRTTSQARTASPTPSPSRSPSQSKTPTHTPSETSSRSQSGSPSQATSGSQTHSGSQRATTSPTGSQEPTPTPSGSASQSRTGSPSPTQSQDASGTQTQAATPSPTPSGSETLTRSQSQSPSETKTRTQFRTPSHTGTRSGSPTGSLTPSETSTASGLRTGTASPTPSQTQSASAELTPSQSPTPSQSQSQAASGSQTASPSRTQAVTGSASQALSRTQSTSMSQATSRTNSATPSVTETPSATGTMSTSPTGSSAPTPTQLSSPSPTPSGAASPSPSASPTQAASESPTGTPSAARTPSGTRSQIRTPSPSPSGTSAPTGSPTQNASPGYTFSQSKSPSGTRSRPLSPSASGTPSALPTASSSLGYTSSQVPSPSPTNSRGASHTSTSSQLRSATPSSSSSDSGTSSATSTPSPSCSVSVTATASSSSSPSATASPSVSPTTSITPSLSATPSQAATLSKTPTTSGSASTSQSATQTLSQSATVTASLSGTASESPTPSVTASQAPTPSQSQTPSTSVRRLELLLGAVGGVAPRLGGGGVAVAAVSDSVPPLMLGLWLSACPAVGASAEPFAVSCSAAGSSSDVAPYAAVYDGSGGVCVGEVSPVALPGSITVGATHGTAGGSGMLACEVISKAGVSDAYAAVALVVSPTLWPVWEDAVVASPITGLLWSTRLGRAAQGGASALAVAAGCGTAGNFSSACQLGVTAAAHTPSVVLAAAQAAWNSTALPENGLGGASSYVLSVPPAAVLVLRARRRAFAPNATNVSLGGVPCGAIIVSEDGCWVAFATPASAALCNGSRTDECGHATLVVSTAPQQSLQRRLAAAVVPAPRGASLACPPFCPGAVGSLVVPAATDAAGTVFSLSTVVGGIIGLPAAAPTASTSAGLYVAASCLAPPSAPPYPDPLSGVCTNATDPLSAACPFGSGAACQACPSGSLCPGGSRRWTRPGYWLPSETSGGASAAVACSAVNGDALARCSGWNIAAGSTQCGPGYLQFSASCGACAARFFRDGTGHCSACPATPYSSWFRFVVLVGLGAAVAGACIVVVAAVLLVSWCRGDSLSRRALRAADTMLWALLLVQILSSAVEESSPALPSTLVFYYRIMNVLIGQGILPPAACPGGGAPFEAELALMAAALAAWGTAIALYAFVPWEEARSRSRRLAGVSLALAIALYPGATATAAGLLRCAPATMAPEGFAALDGGSAAAAAATEADDRTATALVLAANPAFVCWSRGGSHTAAGVVAATTAALYALALPLVCFAWLLRVQLDSRAPSRKLSLQLAPAVAVAPAALASDEVSGSALEAAPREDSEDAAASVPASPEAAGTPRLAGSPKTGALAAAAPPSPASIVPRDPFLVTPLGIGVLPPGCWYTRVVIDLGLVALMSLWRALVPLPDTGSELAAKAGSVCGALILALVHTAAARPYPAGDAWMGSARAAVLFSALGCAALDAAARASDLGLCAPVPLPASYALLALCAAVVPAALLANVVRAITLPAPVALAASASRDSKSDSPVSSAVRPQGVRQQQPWQHQHADAQAAASSSPARAAASVSSGAPDSSGGAAVDLESMPSPSALHALRVSSSRARPPAVGGTGGGGGAYSPALPPILLRGVDAGGYGGGEPVVWHGNPGFTSPGALGRGGPPLGGGGGGSALSVAVASSATTLRLPSALLLRREGALPTPRPPPPPPVYAGGMAAPAPSQRRLWRRGSDAAHILQQPPPLPQQQLSRSRRPSHGYAYAPAASGGGPGPAGAASLGAPGSSGGRGALSPTPARSSPRGGTAPQQEHQQAPHLSGAMPFAPSAAASVGFARRRQPSASSRSRSSTAHLPASFAAALAPGAPPPRSG